MQSHLGSLGAQLGSLRFTAPALLLETHFESPDRAVDDRIPCTVQVFDGGLAQVVRKGLTRRMVNPSVWSDVSAVYFVRDALYGRTKWDVMLHVTCLYRESVSGWSIEVPLIRQIDCRIGVGITDLQGFLRDLVAGDPVERRWIEVLTGHDVNFTRPWWEPEPHQSDMHPLAGDETPGET